MLVWIQVAYMGVRSIYQEPENSSHFLDPGCLAGSRKGFSEVRGVGNFFWNRVAHPHPKLLCGNQEQLPETGKTVLIFFYLGCLPWSVIIGRKPGVITRHRESIHNTMYPAYYLENRKNDYQRPGKQVSSTGTRLSTRIRHIKQKLGNKFHQPGTLFSFTGSELSTWIWYII